MGRHRKFPLGSTATDRANASLKSLIASGGARRTFRLSKEANMALKAVAKAVGASNETSALEFALLFTAAQSKTLDLNNAVIHNSVINNPLTTEDPAS
jgi:hypothetical protein